MLGTQPRIVLTSIVGVKTDAPASTPRGLSSTLTRVWDAPIDASAPREGRLTPRLEPSASRPALPPPAKDGRHDELGHAAPRHHPHPAVPRGLLRASLLPARTLRRHLLIPGTLKRQTGSHQADGLPKARVLSREYKN